MQDPRDFVLRCPACVGAVQEKGDRSSDRFEIGIRLQCLCFQGYRWVTLKSEALSTPFVFAKKPARTGTY